MIQELDSAIEAATPAQTGSKRKSDDNSNRNSAPKKIVLNRNPSVSSENQNGGVALDAVEKDKSDENPDKKIIKLSELSVKEVSELFITLSYIVACNTYNQSKILVLFS